MTHLIGTFMLTLVIISVILFLIWVIRCYCDKNFNKHDNWVSQPAQVSRRFDLRFMEDFSQPKEAQLSGGETIFAYTNFDFFQPQLFKNAYFMVIYITDRRLILTRYPIFRNSMKYKSIPFQEIKNTDTSYFFFGATLKLCLKSGETYKIFLGNNIFSEIVNKNLPKIIDFFENESYLAG